MSYPKTLALLALSGFLAGTVASAAPGPMAAKPTPGLTQFNPNSAWKNVGFGSWVDGHSGAQGVFVAVDVDPSNHNRILTSTQLGGLWLSENAGKTWKNVDFDVPGINYIRSIHFVRDNPALVFAGSGFGVMRSTDGGRTWKKLAAPEIDRSKDYPREPFNMHAVFVESARRGQVVGFGNSSGLCVSRDGGASWAKVFSKPVTSFKFKPGNPDVIYVTAMRSGNINAANWIEFHRSDDGGKTWNEVTAGLPEEKHKNKKEQFAITFIRTTPKHPDRVYLMGFGGNFDLADKHGIPSMWNQRDTSGPLYGVKGFWISDDAGKTFRNTWNDINDVLPPTANRPNLTTNLETVNLQDRTKSRKFNVHGLHQGAWDMVFEISEENPDLMICGGQSPWITTDGGKTWKYHYETQAEANPEIKGDGSPPLATRNHWFHGDFQCCRIIGEKIWMGNDGGLTFSDNRLRSIRTIDIGVTGVEPWGFDMSWQDPDVMLIACNHGPVHLKYPKLWGDDWMNMGGGDSSRCFNNPSDVSVAYGPWSCVHFLPDEKEKGPGSRRAVKTHGLGGDLLESVASPFDAAGAYALYGQRKPKDGKGSELVLFNGRKVEKGVRVFDSKVQDLTTAHAVAGFIFLAEGGRLWLSRDAGETFTNVTPTGVVQEKGKPATPWNKTGYGLRLVAADQKTSKTLYAAGAAPGNKGFVLVSTDDGKTWTDVTGSLYTKIAGDGPVKDLDCQAGTNAGVYAATASRVAYRNATSADWADLSAGLPAANIINYVKTAPSLGLVRIGSNKGVFERPLVEPSVPFVWVRADGFTQYAKNGPYTVKWFDVSAISRKARFKWRFPGGKPASVEGAAATVSYDKPGNYDVFLDIHDGSRAYSWSARGAMKLGTLKAPEVAGAGARLDFTSPGHLESPLGVEAFTPALTLAARITPEAPADRAQFLALSGASDAVALTLDASGRLGAMRSGEHVVGPVVPVGGTSHVAASFEPGKVRFYLNGEAAGEAPLKATGPMRFARGDTLRFGDDKAAFLGGLDDALVLPEAATPARLAPLVAGNTGVAPSGALAYLDFNALLGGSRCIDLASGETFAPAASTTLVADARLQSAFALAEAEAPFVPGRTPLANLRFACSKAEFYGKVGVAKPKADPKEGIEAFLAARRAHADSKGEAVPVSLGGAAPVSVPLAGFSVEAVE